MGAKVAKNVSFIHYRTLIETESALFIGKKRCPWHFVVSMNVCSQHQVVSYENQQQTSCNTLDRKHDGV